jgi:hypothetical protein
MISRRPMGDRQMAKHLRNTALLALPMLAGLLSGCGQDTARSLGLTRDPPDEFQVTTRAPLSLPPSLGNLPPPRPGAQRPQEQGRNPAVGTLAPAAALAAQPSGTSPAEAALLARAGTEAPSDIRRRVDEETLRLERPNQELVDSLMFWRETPPPGTPVDPQREAQRLRENAALGRDAAEGDTPIIQPERRGFLGLF